MSTPTPLFVSAATIKKYGFIEDNVDDKLINGTTLMVQDIELQQLLGTDLYNEIAGQITANTVTVLNAYLLDNIIEKFLINANIASGCIAYTFKMSNKGVVSSNSDNQQPVDKDTLEMVRATWQGRADFYAKRLSDYLFQEQSSYPLYFRNNDMSDIQSKRAKYQSGIFTGNKRRYETERRVNWPYCKNCD